VPEKTVTRSFRINESAFLALEEEARKHSISLNTLVNQLFLSYANFDRYFQRFGMLKISKVAYRKTLKAVPDKEIAETAKEVAKNSGRVVILARYGAMSLQGVLEYLRSLADYAYFFEYNDVLSDGKRVITLTHSLGEKFSIFLIAYVKSLFEQIAMEPKLTSTEDSITINV
jgi:histone H3/H4